MTSKLKTGAKRLKSRIQNMFRSPKAKRHELVGPAHLWQMKRKFQIDFLVKHGLKPECHFLDMGCGTLRGGIPVIELLEPGHYNGIDVREEALAEARLELAEHKLEHKNPRLVTPDQAREQLETDSIDYAWAFSVLFHLTDEILDHELELIARVLKPDGVFYANVMLGEQEDSSWERFPFRWRTMETYQDMLNKHGLQAESIGDLKSLGHESNNTARGDEQTMLKITPIPS